MTINILRTLPDNLVLRRGRPDDAERLAEFNARWLSDDGPEEPEEALAVWTRDLFTRPHPTFSPELTTIVEDTSTGEIVSSALLFPQTWTYAGIPFGVGRPELISTHADYRRRGLVRIQMEMLHVWSAEMGHRMQAITGIPWFYRQFEYEMALDLHGGRYAYPPNVPQLKKGEAEPFTIRPATLEDIPFLKKTYAAMCQRHLIACEMDDAVWEYAISGSSPGNLIRMVVGILSRPNGAPAAFFAHHDNLAGTSLHLAYFAAVEGESWGELTPPLMRYLLKAGSQYAKKEGKSGCESLYFRLAADHPVFRMMPGRFPKVRTPYAWYIRIPDLPDFLTHITPILDSRLAESELRTYTAEVKLGFYTSGVKLGIEDGKLLKAETWQPQPGDEGGIRFPDHSFLSLLCGRRSYEELYQFYADCFSTKDEYDLLMNTWFPQKTSNVWGIE